MATRNSAQTLIKWTIIVLSAVNMVGLTIAVIRTSMESEPLTWDQVLFIGITFLIFMVPIIGAWRQSYMFLIIGGIALVLSIIYSFMGLKSRSELNLLMAALAVFTFSYALFIRKRDSSLMNNSDSS